MFIRLAKDAERVLLGYSWPGNVRELEHIMSRAALKASADSNKASVITVTLTHIGLNAQDTQPAAAPIAIPIEATKTAGLRESTIAFQRAFVERTLAEHHGNIAAAAKALKLDRGNLARLARRIGVSRLEKVRVS